MMQDNTKTFIKSTFPYFSELYSFTKQKREKSKKIKGISRLSEKEYPSFLEKTYYSRTGHKLDLKNPERFTEKLQWRKLYDQDPIYSFLSDKYLVRQWVEKKIGANYLVPLLGVWEHFKDIDFSALPNAFVLKTNNASHTNIIVKDKKDFYRRRKIANLKMDYWLRTPFSYLEGLELHYNQIKPLIIAEQYLKPKEGKSDLTDYKFYCFDGTPVACQVIGNRTNGETIDFFDMDWNHLEIKRPPHDNAGDLVVKPSNYNHLVELAKILCQGFKHVRVDLYENYGKIYFGEMTFTSASGLIVFDPDEWDYKFGKLWDIHSQQIDKSKVNCSVI